MKLRDYLVVKTSPVPKMENVVLYNNFRVTVLNNRLFRLELGTKESFTDCATQKVFFRNHKKVDFEIKENTDCLIIKTSACELVLKNDIETSYIVLNGKNIALDNSENLKGTARTLDMCGYSYKHKVLRDGKIQLLTHRDPRFLDDGVLSKNGVAVIDDSDSFLLHEDGFAYPRDVEEKDIYIFAYGRDYKNAIKGLFSICGPSPMLSKYVFGNWWSRYFAYTDKTYKKLMLEFEKKDVPLTVATLDMDWHYVDLVKEIGPQCEGLRGWTGWSWNPAMFPDPEGFMEWLHKKGLKVTLNLHPKDGIRFYEDCYKEVCEYVGQDYKKEEPVEFDFSDPTFVNAYFDVVIKGLEKQGVDFWWIDWQQGIRIEGKLGTYDPLWSVNHYSYLASQRDNRRPLILSRYSGWGSHRYPLGFSGDSIITWEMLDYIEAFTARASNIGYYYWSHDIGGHIEGIKDDELYIRWLEFAVFSPILRLHSTNQDLMGKEPWNFAKGTELIAEDLLRLRSKLVPYIYSLSAKAHFDGTPFIEPMYYEYPDDERAYEVDSQYYFGSLLVAPIAKKSEGNTGLAKKRVWLPEGKWFDLSTGIIYNGNRFIDVYRYIEETPVFMPYNSLFIAKEDDKICINIFGEKASFELYEDDGESLDYEKGIYNITDINVETINNEIIIKINKGKLTELIEKTRNYRLIFENIVSGTVVADNGNCIVNNDEDCLIVDINNSDTSKDIVIKVTNTKEISNKERIDERIDKMFKRLNGENLSISRSYELFKQNGYSAIENDSELPGQFICALKEFV